jgi:hypothetical protein
LASDVEGQHLQIFAVSPNKDLEHVVYQRTKVSQAVREYTLMSNPQKFTTSSRQPALDIPITEQAVEKTIYTTAEQFPTLLRRSEVVATETMTLSPVEAALERTTRKTQELLANEKLAAPGVDDGARERLTEDLFASVDPSSDSSVARYRNLVTTPEVADNASNDVDPDALEKKTEELDPLQLALKVALLDHALAIKRCLGVYRKPQHLATKSQLIPRFESAFAPELASLFLDRDGLFDDEPDDEALEVSDNASRNGHASINAAPNGDRDNTEQRLGRRSSIPFLRRGNSRQRGEENGREGRTRERSSSRRRLSLFRSGADNGVAKKHASYRQSAQVTGEQ